MRTALLLSLVSGLVVAARTSMPVAGPSAVQPMQNPPECPHTWDSMKIGRRDAPVSPVPREADWPSVNIPEFNDCQRFIRALDGSTKRTYTDGYFAIFASFALDTLEERLTPVETCEAGCQAIEGQRVLTYAVPAAWIYAQREAWPTLGIEPGANCLLLFKDGGRWKAKMVPVPIQNRADRTCLEDIDPRTVSGYELLVKATRVPGLKDEDYPPVARWDWDPGTQDQYIGIKCGAVWCEVGNVEGFTGSRTHAEFTEDNSGLYTPQDAWQRRTVAVKGWYDEQYLAIRDNGVTRPSAIIGMVFPDFQLGSHDREDQFRPQGATIWTRVARVALRVDDNWVTSREGLLDDLLSYRKKLNFELTGSGGRLNEIFLCEGSSAQCLPRDLSVNTTCHAQNDPSTRVLWAKIVAAGTGAASYRCVTFRQVRTNMVVPGTVRWRWLATDEGDWIRCETGCCEVEARM